MVLSFKPHTREVKCWPHFTDETRIMCNMAILVDEVGIWKYFLEQIIELLNENF